MGLSSKFLLLLVVCVAFQTISAWPQFNIFRWRNLGYDINRAADDAERDVRKETLNVKNKVWKDTNKMLRKGGSSEAFLTCVMEVHRSVLIQTDDSSERAITCIKEIRTKVNGVDEKELTPREVSAIKNQLKGQIKACRNTNKYELKGCQVEFSTKAQRCFMVEDNPAP